MWLSGTGKSRFVEALAHPAIEQDLRVARLVPLIRIVRLLAEHSTVARRWLSSVATRVVRSHDRILGLLRKSLSARGGRLLLDEAVDGRILLPPQTLAVMLGFSGHP